MYSSWSGRVVVFTRIFDLLWLNREQVASDILLISDLVETNSVMVSDYPLDQYFQFVKNMLLHEVISESPIHSTSIKSSLTFRVNFDKVMQLQLYIIIPYTVGLYYLSTLPCYARAGHIFTSSE